jgi:hypothetical protein
MNMNNVEAGGILCNIERMKQMNKDRTSWTLAEWAAYFEPADSHHVMTSVEMAAAALWMMDHSYPVPTDCPKRPETTTCDGGCPVFRPACLMFKDCRFSRGMCDEINVVAKCPTCKEIFNPEELRDSLSKREYQISHMCQKCQDKVFGGDHGDRD